MIFRLVKIVLLLLFGTIVGMLMGFAYASHLFGADVVADQMARLIGGDAVMDVPPPSSTASLEGFQYATAALIPKLGACIGFGVAVSVLLGAVSFRLMKNMVKAVKPNVRSVTAEDGSVKYVKDKQQKQQLEEARPENDSSS